MERPLKILVLGYAIGFPMGGQIWMMLHYLLGLARMGHEVLFLEDTSDWSYPFHPVHGYSRKDSSFGRLVLDNMFARHGLAGRWAYFSELENELYGVSREALDRFCAEADLLLNISGVNPLRENYMQPRVKAIIDTDPVFTQVKVAEDEGTLEYYTAHDACFTYGCNIPSADIGVPHSGIEWKPILPPVVLEEWSPLETPGSAYTTIGTWNTKGRDIVLNGRQLPWRKSVRYEPILEMPRRLPGIHLDLTFSGMQDDARRFSRHGWIVRDALMVSRDPMGYRDYIRNSRGEFTVAKDQNVQLKSGWFSDRSACYLAAGRPVVTEDTGFSTYLPVGEGILAFETQDEAIDCIKRIEADPKRHSQSAHRIARENFDARKILGGLLRELDLN
jgi:hypothetical protein